jgi:hypothetical protein
VPSSTSVCCHLSSVAGRGVQPARLTDGPWTYSVHSLTYISTPYSTYLSLFPVSCSQLIDPQFNTLANQHVNNSHNLSPVLSIAAAYRLHMSWLQETGKSERYVEYGVEIYVSECTLGAFAWQAAALGKSSLKRMGHAGCSRNF